MKVQITEAEALTMEASQLIGNLNDDLLEFDSWLSAISSPDGDGGPKWVYALERLYDRLHASSEALEVMLCKRVFPRVKEVPHVDAD